MCMLKQWGHPQAPLLGERDLGTWLALDNPLTYTCNLLWTAVELLLRMWLIFTAQACQVVMHLHSVYEPHPYNRSSMLQHFKCSHMIEIHNRILFNFYPGLPHMHNSFVYLSNYMNHRTSITITSPQLYITSPCIPFVNLLEMLWYEIQSYVVYGGWAVLWLWFQTFHE